MGAVANLEQRLRGLLDAGVALASELSLDDLLQKLVETAAALTGARYAALGVVDRTGTTLERFLAVGVDPETQAAIGELPRGRGILGVLIREGRPLRLRDLTEDPRSVGFPPGHPPMRTFLGVPLLLRGVEHGNLYLTEKEGGEEFTEEDEELVTLLAAQAAVAIENARLYESTTRWLRQLESLTEVTNAIASELHLPRLLELVARRLRELLEARLVLIALPDAAGELGVEVAEGERAEEVRGMRLSRTGSKAGRVLERRRSERIDSVLDDPEVDQRITRALGARAGLWVPLLLRDRPIGIIVAHDKAAPAGRRDPRFSEQDLRLAEAFAARVAVAIDLSERVTRESLRRVITAQELERRRLARELHDETGQALTSILLGIQALKTAEEGERDKAVEQLRELAVAALADVRRLASDLRPRVLDDFGLAAALDRLTHSVADQAGLTIELEAKLGERLPEEVESALYRMVQEALTNIVRHAGARNVSILLAKSGRTAVAVVEDDGQGFSLREIDEDSFGLAAMRERLALLGGELTVESAPGAGTTLRASVPLP